MDNLSIERYVPGDEDALIPMIVQIQRQEFGINITAEDQPDLKQIPAFYQTGNGDFWVARMQGKVIGTIALKDIGNGEAALRKMFVAAPWRGRDLGVARQMLERLIDTAKTRGVHRIFLGTTDRFLAAHHLYEKQGFTLVDASDLPASFPRMVVDTRFYLMEL